MILTLKAILPKKRRYAAFVAYIFSGVNLKKGS